MASRKNFQIAFFSKLERVQEESSMSETSSCTYRDVVSGKQSTAASESSLPAPCNVVTKKGLPARPPLLKFLGNYMGNANVCQWSSPKLEPQGKFRVYSFCLGHSLRGLRLGGRNRFWLSLRIEVVSGSIPPKTIEAEKEEISFKHKIWKNLVKKIS
mgnify:CR=1 FL=1